MARKPSNLPLIAGVVVAGVMLLGINIMQQNSDPAIVKKKREEAEREARKVEASKVAEANVDAPTDPSAGNEVASWSAKKTFGKPNGKPEITVTWEWSPAVQGDPSSIQKTVEAIIREFPTATVVAVNADMTPDAGLPGISVDKIKRVGASPQGVFPPTSALIAQLKSED